MKITNGSIKAGEALTPVPDKEHTSWTLVVRPEQNKNSSSLEVEVHADSVVGKKANGNVIAIDSVSLNTASSVLEQWAVSATANSSEYSATKATGAPDTGLEVGQFQKMKPNAWTENEDHRGRSNNIRLDYATGVFISSIVVRETLGIVGDISKIEAQHRNDGTPSQNGGWDILYTKKRPLHK
ncbi:hypothetical protein BPUTSESOX_2340 [uncultured Gammaproteobacteria bacterium]|nr:hypothetical protein BPUTSESOX_2340 [uncultured Gammaproteobacteria bacterium]